MNSLTLTFLAWGCLGTCLSQRAMALLWWLLLAPATIYAAEEAALTAEALGNQVQRLYDVGVAGKLHRLLAHMDDIMQAQVIITVAGMEGALASVVGGMASCPVIAVPTSVAAPGFIRRFVGPAFTVDPVEANERR